MFPNPSSEPLVMKCWNVSVSKAITFYGRRSLADKSDVCMLISARFVSRNPHRRFTDGHIGWYVLSYRSWKLGRHGRGDGFG